MGFLQLLLSNSRYYRKLRKGKWYAMLIHVGEHKSIDVWKHEDDLLSSDCNIFDVEEYR